jgi:hypothetical protein
MAGIDENHGRSRRLGTEDQGWSSIGWVLDGRLIDRSGDVVCSLHRAQGDEEREFLGLASKPRATSFLVWSQNQGRWFLPIWPQNWWLRVFRFGPQNWQLWFDDLGLKITMMIFWFVPQNQVGYGLSVVAQN